MPGFNSMLIFLSFMINFSYGQNKKKSTFTDLTHFSQVFNKNKGYRIYLPEGYQESNKRYPVIYYFHGWGGRHYKNYSENFGFELIGDLVDKYQAILVMWDGSMEETELRPYNIGYHKDMKYKAQMKDYFLELINHIDITYKTKSDRNSRGIVGHSMGGFMAFYMAGKYPDKICAAVDNAGSTEFFIGFPENYSLYPIRYTFDNLKDVQIRLHNSSVGELTSLNDEIHNAAKLEGNLKYEYWKFDGGHRMDKPGETESLDKAMNFIVNAFRNPIPLKEKWSHYDLYNDFKVWGYSIYSNKDQPGFLFLQDVSESGFGFYTKKWLPNGASLTDFHSTIITKNSYEPYTNYFIKDYNFKEKTVLKNIVKSDSLGQLQFNLNSDGHEIGIYKEEGEPKLTFIDYVIGKKNKMLYVGQENKLRLKVLNLGKSVKSSQKVYISLSSNDKSTTFMPSKIEGDLDSNGHVSLPDIKVFCAKKATIDGTPPEVRITLKLNFGDVLTEEEFEVPVFYDVPFFDKLTIDDGIFLRDSIMGKGNGDKVVSPGEEIMIYTDGHRTQLYYDDPYVIQEKLFDETLPAIWTEDGITLSSIIKISEDCPDNHQILFLAKYETKSHMPIVRTVYWGKINMKVVKINSQ